LLKTSAQRFACRSNRAALARDLREAPEHPLDLWSLLKSVATKRTERKKAAQVIAQRFHKAKRLKELSFGFAAPSSVSESGVQIKGIQNDNK